MSRDYELGPVGAVADAAAASAATSAATVSDAIAGGHAHDAAAAQAGIDRVQPARRVVVKVGSSSISGVNREQIETLVDVLVTLREHAEVVLVSSGAIATGLPFLGLEERPGDLPTEQAAAAVGQNVLMNRYQRSLNRHGVIAAQILLTAADIERDEPRHNARNAIERLLGLGMLAIVNENDTVATHEIRFGDNDRLAALVSKLIGADALILLSDVESLYTAPPGEPGATRIADVPYGDELRGVKFGSTSSKVGTGGASTKVEAARVAADHGARVLVTATARFAEIAVDFVLGVREHAIGTVFAPSPVPAPVDGLVTAPIRVVS